jgi:hypothetical protein
MCSFSKTVALRRGPVPLGPPRLPTLQYITDRPSLQYRAVFLFEAEHPSPHYSATVETLRSDRLEEEIGGYTKDATRNSRLMLL